MSRFSIASLARNALSGHRRWARTWRDASPKSGYDIIIVGGGGHGLAAAYYLAKVHGMTNVAVIEKGWIGSGNAGRNTTIIRSNYGLPGNEPFYEWSMKLWEGLEQELNYNAMVSQRGVLNLYHSDGQRDAFARRGNAVRLHGADAELLDRNAVRKLAPFLNFDHARFPIEGGLFQGRGGTARHDAVVWGYARGASALGADIIQNCELTGFVRDASGAVTGIETTRGLIRAGKVGLAVAGNSSRVRPWPTCACPSKVMFSKLSSANRSSRSFRGSSSSALGTSTSANRTRVGSFSVAISMAITAMRAAVTCPWLSMFAKAPWR